MGHRQLSFSKVFGKINKGMVLIATRTDNTNYRFSFTISKAIVCSITACTCQFFYICRSATCPFSV